MTWSLFSQSQVSPKSWAEAVLSAGGWPKTDANIQSLIAWALREGGGGQYNPLNTTLSEPGATSFNSVNVENYTSWHQGVTATVATLQGSYYGDVRSALKSGQGLGSGSYSGLLTWSGHGYSNVSGTWASAAQYMGGSAVALPGVGKGLSSSGSSSGGGSGGDSVGNLFGAVWDSLWGSHGGLAQAAQDASGLGGVAGAIGTLTLPLVKIAEAVDWFVQPNHWIRIFCGLGGGLLAGAGIWNLSHAGRDASSVTVAGTSVPTSWGGSMALPIGVLELGLGGVGLFVAFHNLPPTVRTFPDFLSYLQQEIHKAPSKAPAPAKAAA